MIHLFLSCLTTKFQMCFLKQKTIVFIDILVPQSFGGAQLSFTWIFSWSVTVKQLLVDYNTLKSLFSVVILFKCCPDYTKMLSSFHWNWSEFCQNLAQFLVKNPKIWGCRHPAHGCIHYIFAVINNSSILIIFQSIKHFTSISWWN